MIRSEFAAFLLAIQFLTRIPVPTQWCYSTERQAAASRYFPLVGAIIGGACWLSYALAAKLWTANIALALSMAAGCVLTGAFHEDGLADTADGVGGGLNREEALAIMRDSRLGTYGTLALGLTLALKFATLSAVPPTMLAWTLILGHGLSRASAMLTVATSRYQRDEGTGKPTADGLSSSSQLVLLASTGLGVFLLFNIFGDTATACALLGLGCGHGLARATFEPKLGGYTGDTLGAVQQLSELGLYLGIAAWVG